MKTTAKATGPFFDHDPARTFRQNARDMMEAVAREGVKDVTGRMAGQRDPVSIGGGRVADRVIGFVDYRGRKPDSITAVVLVKRAGLPRAAAIALAAAGSEVESRTHAFRRTSGDIRRARAINQAELLKGIN